MRGRPLFSIASVGRTLHRVLSWTLPDFGDLGIGPGVAEEVDGMLMAAGPAPERPVEHGLGENDDVPRLHLERDMGNLLLGEPEGPVTGVHAGLTQGRQRIRVARDVRSGDDSQAAAVAGQGLGVEPDLDPAQAAGKGVPRMPRGWLDAQPPLRLVENEVGAAQIDPDIVDAVVVEQAEQERPPLEERLDEFGRLSRKRLPAPVLFENLLGLALQDRRLPGVEEPGQQEETEDFEVGYLFR